MPMLGACPAPVGIIPYRLQHLPWSTLLNANPNFLADTAKVDSAAVEPLPRSRKVYETGSRPDLRVPFREISQDDTPTLYGGETNPPLTVYDSSDPYTAPAVRINNRAGLAQLRQDGI